ESTRRNSLPFLLAMGNTLRLAGDERAAQELYRRGLAQIEHADGPWLMWRAAVLPGRGPSEEAVKTAKRLVSESEPEGPFTNILRLWLALEVFAPSGAHQLVIDLLDEYLSRPGSWSIEGLMPDPRFDAVRDDPAFKALVAKYRRHS